jgi:hypothetical protein
MSALANVIPLKSYQKNRLALAVEPQLPEPAALYALIVLAFLLHQPTAEVGTCGQCGEQWPCEQVRLAYRLREAF